MSAPGPHGDNSLAVIAQAYNLELAGQNSEAADLYREALSQPGLTPATQAHASLRLALLLLESGDIERAIELLEFASATGDNLHVRTHALWHLATALLTHSPAASPRVAMALLDYSGTDPAPAILHLRGFECLAHSSEYDLPIDRISAALDRLPETVDADLAGAWIQAGFAFESKAHLEAARQTYAALLDRSCVPAGVRANALLRLGIVIDALGRWHESESFFRAAYGAPDVPPPVRREAAIRLADALYLAEDFGSSLPMYGELLGDAELDVRQRAKARLRHALCLIRSGDLARGTDELQICTDESLTGPEISLKAENMLAEALERLGRTQEARDCYRRIIGHASSEPSMKTAALMRLRALSR